MSKQFCALTLAWACAACGAELPRFTDYPVKEAWQGSSAPIKLLTRSERMFKTVLTQASKEPPDFAGHYRFAGWGCGSLCGAGAIIDLQSGKVYQPPLGGKGGGWSRWISCSALFEGTGYEYHVDSRMMIVRCGRNFDEHGKNWPEIDYLLWQGNGFKNLLRIPEKQLP
jgi:hypothetical protein